VQAVRIAECSINLECHLEWHHPLYENSHWHLFAGGVLHLAMDETLMNPDPVARMRLLKLMYNVRSTFHPLTGEQYGPNTLGLLSRIVDIFNPQWHLKDSD
jgi:flavin reductase (DIM6/NTAB) family NADH-FMN oxidoreductase RutF